MRTKPKVGVYCSVDVMRYRLGTLKLPDHYKEKLSTYFMELAGQTVRESQVATALEKFEKIYFSDFPDSVWPTVGLELTRPRDHSDRFPFEAR